MSTEPTNANAPSAVVAASEPEKAPEPANTAATAHTTAAPQPEAAEAVEAPKPSEASAEPAGDGTANATNTTANAPAKPKEELTDEDIKLLPLRQYLEMTVVGVLMQGMQQICRKRPEDPVSFLSDFILRNNPRKRKAEDAAGEADEEPDKQAAPAAMPIEQT
jgi:protein dpy-30